MAGGGQLGGGEKPKRGKSTRKKKKRVGFHIDMTPLVDITFLLLTFFMFTTTMAQPQVMEMSVPPEMDEGVEVRQSDLLQIFLDGDNGLFYASGADDPQSVELSKLKALAIRETLDHPEPNKKIIALKVQKNADYGSVVDILDELNLAEQNIIQKVAELKTEDGKPMKRERRFTIAKFSEEDEEKIAQLKGTQEVE
ncbi:MAG: ExbD/TolR family protein [Candidatus Kapaibacterium sp.]